MHENPRASSSSQLLSLLGLNQKKDRSSKSGSNDHIIFTQMDLELCN
jgi:hypothetical protein